MTFFALEKKSKKSRARVGVLATAHGNVATPFFMPIATRGPVKNVSVSELKELGAEIILSNTYHMFLEPGPVRVKKLGGLHGLMGWDRSILTDSGGYQVFSLATSFRKKIDDHGVVFRSDRDRCIFGKKKNPLVIFTSGLILRTKNFPLIENRLTQCAIA